MMRQRWAYCGLLAALLGLGGVASAHPGHEHVANNGIWPDHEESDASAGLAALSAPAETTETPTIALATAPNDTYISNWMLSTGVTGYSTQDATTNSIVTNVLADVNTVAYNDDYVYVRTSGIPSHDIGSADDPNPAKAGDLNATYRISRNPVEETGEKTATGLSSIGIMVNGVSFYNQSDGTAWNAAANDLSGQVGGGAPPGGDGPGGGGPPGGDMGGEETTTWSTNALWSRREGLDDAGGHSSPEFGQTNPDGSILGLYHYHQTPFGLMDQLDPGNDGDMGSPIVGFAFDGFPVVGPYAYEEQNDGSLDVVAMTSSYGLLEDNGVDEPRGPNAPTVADYELGSFIEDFVYYEGSGMLNEYNMAFVTFDDDGRAILTDEANPDGTWAYFLTMDVLNAMTGNETEIDGNLAFPYIVGPEYYGVVDSELLDAGSMIVVPDDVTFHFQYVPEPTALALLGCCLLWPSRLRKQKV